MAFFRFIGSDSFYFSLDERKDTKFADKETRGRETKRNTCHLLIYSNEKKDAAGEELFMWPISLVIFTFASLSLSLFLWLPLHTWVRTQGWARDGPNLNDSISEKKDKKYRRGIIILFWRTFSSLFKWPSDHSIDHTHTQGPVCCVW